MAATQQVQTEWLTYERDGVTIPAYLASPDGTGPWPGIVMIHENPGLTDHRQEVTRELAAEGYVVLTPNLYARIGGKAPDDEDEHARHLKVGLAVPDEQVFQDLMAGCAVLHGRSDVTSQRMGLIGFCMGGAKGLYTACKTDAFRCFVDFYGPTEQSAERYGIGRSLLPLVKDLTCPIQFHVGDRDTTCTRSKPRRCGKNWHGTARRPRATRTRAPSTGSTATAPDTMHPQPRSPGSAPWPSSGPTSRPKYTDS